AALLVAAITATLSRWQAGRHGDRNGHARLLIPALIAAALGMTAMMWLASPVLMFAGMVLFGAGFGVIENATFALLIQQLRQGQRTVEPRLRRRIRYRPGRLRPVRRPRRLPGGVRPDRHVDAGSTPRRPARAESRGQHSYLTQFAAAEQDRQWAVLSGSRPLP